MAIPPQRTLIRRVSLSLGAAALAAGALVAGSPMAAAAPAPKVTSLLNDPAALAAVKAAAASGYVVPAKLAANCGALQ